MKKNFCLYPFVGFDLDNSGKLRICCHNNAWHRVSLNKPFNSKDFNIEEDYNNPLHRELRSYMMKDERHPSCQKCWEAEDAGKESYRTWFNNSFDLESKDPEYWLSKCDNQGRIKDIEYLYLEITFGNKCNLKCVMCNGYNSTLYAKEQFDNQEITIQHYETMLSLDWFKDPNEFEKLYPYINKVQRIHVLGGEPLLIEHEPVLQKFIELGLSKNIILSYNSNLTVLPKKVLDTWKEFKRVFLCVSVDGYGKLNEFIRYPMSWTKLEKNIDEVYNMAIPNLEMQIHATFGTMNYLGFPELLAWIQDVSKKYSIVDPAPFVNYIYAPRYFDPIHLPADIKKKGYELFQIWKERNQQTAKHERLQNLEGYYQKILEKVGDPKQYQQAVDKIKYFETIRKISYPNYD